MQNSWFVVVPPILVLLLSMTTHRIILSLFAGLASATLIFHDFAIIPAIKTTFFRLWEIIQLDHFLSWDAFWKSSNLFIYLFLLFLGIIIVLIRQSGGTQAYARFIYPKLKDKKAAETSSLILSLILFMDEYLNILTVGSIMHPLTDRFKIPRAKLAFLVNAMAASLCIIVPISSWGAFILLQLDNSGISPAPGPGALILATPLNIFVQAIPFAFYSLIIIASLFFIVRKKISFGPMRTQELIAEKTGNLYGGKMPKMTPHKVSKENASLLDFLFPLILLVSSVLISLVATNFVAERALFIGGSITLTASIIFYLIRKSITFKQLINIFAQGVELMAPSLIVITLAWTFGSILTNDLMTGQFLASKMTGMISIPLFPLLFFVVTTLTTLAIGSAWGSMAIMFPIAIPMLVTLHQASPPILLTDIPSVLPTIAAILTGAVAGIHFSPISDVVIMAATSTGAHHIDHIKTQQIYILPVFFASCVSFFLSGLLLEQQAYINVFVSLGVGLGIAFLIY
ncbi:hypothetical protein KAT92_00845, partial [Candidatus Babeliales bacterium]|nr:hypothetical protein [Candidatus Babeliales bacterium]